MKIQKINRVTILIAVLAIVVFHAMSFSQDATPPPETPVMVDGQIKAITAEQIKSGVESDKASRAANSELRIIRAPWERDDEVGKLPNQYLASFLLQCSEDMYIQSISIQSDTPHANQLINNLRLMFDYNAISFQPFLTPKGNGYEAKFVTNQFCNDGPGHYLNLVVDLPPSAMGAVRVSVSDIVLTGVNSRKIPVYTLPVFSGMHTIIAPHVPGTNVKTEDGTIWLIANDGTRRRYTSLDAFDSYPFNDRNLIVPINVADWGLTMGDPILPQEGKIYRWNGIVYEMSDGYRVAFLTPAIQQAMGFTAYLPFNADLSEAIPGPTVSTTTEKHQKGTLINDNGTVYYVTALSKIGFASMDAYRSFFGNDFTRVVPATSGDRGLPVESGLIGLRKPGQLTPR